MPDLSGLSALICGASEGIGRATAIELGSCGVQITALARNQERLQTLKDHLPSTTCFTAIAADLNDHTTLLSKLARIDQHYDILVCNSSGPKPSKLISTSEEDFSSAIHQHLATNHLLARRCLPSMKEQQYGRIINILSTSVQCPIPGLGVSNATRAAVASWAKTLSQEVAKWGITVNNVLPGFTKTKRLESIIAGKAAHEGSEEQTIVHAMKQSVPMGRFAEPTEIAKAIAFLGSRDASYITGISLAVDGGRTPAL